MNASGFDRNLIYDLGMHWGSDTKFYLDKGFCVVALEANPKMVASAKSSFSTEIEEGRLTIIDRALWSTNDDTISFFLNKEKDDWSSALKTWAEKEGHRSEEIKVRTITLDRMFDHYGVPYYVKCDVEGADHHFVQQLHSDSRRPAFVSVEAASLELLAYLFAAGYDHAQIVNQAFNQSVVPPNPAREGKHVAVRFNGLMSGLFGRDLDPTRWLKFEKAAQNYLDYKSLGQRDKILAPGWIDFHVTSSKIITSSKN